MREKKRENKIKWEKKTKNEGKCKGNGWAFSENLLVYNKWVIQIRSSISLIGSINMTNFWIRYIENKKNYKKEQKEKHGTTVKPHYLELPRKLKKWFEELLGLALIFNYPVTDYWGRWCSHGWQGFCDSVSFNILKRQLWLISLT